MIFQDNPINNDNSGRNRVQWGTARNPKERLRHRPHISHSTNSRGSEYVQYYSSLDADILFGDQFIDEVVSIAWQVQQNTMPIFGYNSYTFDDIAVGSRMISGQFTVNFTEANYLSRILTVMQSISRKMYGKDLVTTTSFLSPEKKRMNLPIWDRGFDIVIGYGEKLKNSPKDYDHVTMLDCCQLTGCTQQLDSNGEPLTETYTFIARDMKFIEAAQYYSSNSEDTETNIPEASMFANKIVGNIVKSSCSIVLTCELIDNIYQDNDPNSSDNLTIFIDELGPVGLIMHKEDNVFRKILSAPDTNKIISAAEQNGLNKIEANVKFLFINGESDEKVAMESSIMLNIAE